MPLTGCARFQGGSPCRLSGAAGVGAEREHPCVTRPPDPPSPLDAWLAARDGSLAGASWVWNREPLSGPSQRVRAVQRQELSGGSRETSLRAAARIWWWLKRRTAQGFGDRPLVFNITAAVYSAY